MKKLISLLIATFFGVFMSISLSAMAGQSPLGVNSAINTSGYYAPMNLDSQGGVRVNDGGTASSLALAASAVVKATPGVIVRVSVTVAGTAPGNVYDAATLATAGAANLVGVIPNTVGVYYFSFPMQTGIVVAPGTGQTVSVSYQ